MVLFPKYQLTRKGLSPPAAALPASFMLPSLFFWLCPPVPFLLSLSPSAAPGQHCRGGWQSEQIGSDISQTWEELVGAIQYLLPSELMCFVWMRAFLFQVPVMVGGPPHSPSPWAPTRVTCVQGNRGLRMLWNHIYYLMHKMKLQAKSQFLIMQIFTNFARQAIPFFWFDRNQLLREIYPHFLHTLDPAVATRF